MTVENDTSEIGYDYEKKETTGQQNKYSTSYEKFIFKDIDSLLCIFES